MAQPSADEELHLKTHTHHLLAQVFIWIFFHLPQSMSSQPTASSLLTSARADQGAVYKDLRVTTFTLFYYSV